MVEILRQQPLYTALSKEKKYRQVRNIIAHLSFIYLVRLGPLSFLWLFHLSGIKINVIRCTLASQLCIVLSFTYCRQR